MVQRRIAILGAGWAGLAAALAIARAGHQVLLVDAARHPGGRARTVHLDGAELDNGQHVLVGACRATLAAMESVGQSAADAFQSLPLGFEQRAREDFSWHFQPASARPWHLLQALLTVESQTCGWQRWQMLWGAQRLLYRVPRVEDSVRNWLREARQPPFLQEVLWDPLCIAVMNTPPERASCRIFQNVLHQTLRGGDAAARLLIPRHSLGALFPEPALRTLRHFAFAEHWGARVTELVSPTQGELGLVLRSGDTLAADAVILAIPPRAAARVLRGWGALDAMRSQLASLGSCAICTVFLRYREPVDWLPPLTGLLRQPGQWLIPRSVAGEPHWLAVVLSAVESLSTVHRDSLPEQVGRDLAACFPRLGLPENGQVICEKQATLDARVGLDEIRPPVRTAVPGIYLGGDYCTPGLPSTLEAAVLAGQAAARAVLEDYPLGMESG